MGEPEVRAAARVIRSQYLFRYGSPNDETNQFEKEFARFTGARFAVATTSGTASLMAALAGLGVGMGDEVIVPGYTFIATALAVLALGAVPVVADVDQGLTLDPLEVKKKLSRRTRCIIPVHMQGLIADMDGLRKAAGKVPILEDACQATGGRWRGKRVGTLGAAGAFSHNHYKTMSSGEGGTVVTSDPSLHERMKMYHDAAGYYFDKRYTAFGMKYTAGLQFRMNEVQAAILRIQLKRVPGFLKRMNALKRRLHAALAGHPVCPAAPVHDMAGDCGKVVILRLDSAARATLLADRLNARGVLAHSWFRSLENDRHIYTTWDCVLKKRGHFDPRQDPYRTTPAGRAIRYSRDMCPRVLDLLRRSVALLIEPQWSVSRAGAVIKVVDRTARAV